MAEAGPQNISRSKRWITALLRVLGVALLGLVVWKVHWRDTIVLADGTEIAGEIVGPIPTRDGWEKGAEVEFRAADEAASARYGRDALRIEKAKKGQPPVPDVNEGLIRIVRNSDKSLLLAGLVLYGFITQIGVSRWWLLLRAQEIRLRYGLAHRLTFLGFFFNNVVPGPTGGDLVKAVYAAKLAAADKKAQAVVTVVIDRVVGIIALALIAAGVLLTKLDDPVYRELALFIGLFLGGVALASVLFFSRRLRTLIRFESWSAKLPGGGLIRKADEAVFLWRDHKRAVAVALLLSFANQLSIQAMMLMFASALHVTTQGGEALAWSTYMAVLPVCFIVTALPLLPGGWGVREAAFVYWFGLVGVERNPAIALSVVNGMTGLFWSLLGGVYFLTDREAVRSAESSAAESAS